MSFGELLQEARERRGISLEEAEEATKIRRKHLAALEANDVRSLPGPVYARGFLRNYAAYLGLDPAELLALFPYQPEPVAIQPWTPLRPPPSRSLLTWFPVLALILLLILFAAYVYGGEEPGVAGPSQPSPASNLPLVLPTLAPARTSTPTPTPTQVASPTPTPTPLRVEVSVKALASSWVAVEIDERADFSGTLKPGESRTWVGQEKVSMRTGNAGALEVSLNGRAQGPLGNPGQMLNAEWRPTGMVIATATASPRQPAAPPPKAPARGQ